MVPVPATSALVGALSWAFTVAPAGSGAATSLWWALPGAAAAGDAPFPWRPLALLAAAALAVYGAACVWWPFSSCRAGCDGGRRRSPSGKAWRRCWWCQGKGHRVRWGRRFFDAVFRGRGWKADV